MRKVPRHHLAALYVATLIATGPRLYIAIGDVEGHGDWLLVLAGIGMSVMASSGNLIIGHIAWTATRHRLLLLRSWIVLLIFYAGAVAPSIAVRARESAIADVISLEYVLRAIPPLEGLAASVAPIATLIWCTLFVVVPEASAALILVALHARAEDEHDRAKTERDQALTEQNRALLEQVRTRDRSLTERVPEAVPVGRSSALTTAEIVELVQRNDPAVSHDGIRTALRRLAGRGAVAREPNDNNVFVYWRES